MTYQKVIKYCEENNLSIMAFEKLCGLSNGTVSKWENGKDGPKIKTLKLIEEATRIPIKEWID